MANRPASGVRRFRRVALQAVVRAASHFKRLFAQLFKERLMSGQSKEFRDNPDCHLSSERKKCAQVQFSQAWQLGATQVRLIWRRRLRKCPRR